MTLLGLALLVAGGAVTWRFGRGSGPYRAAPWPGLTPRGAGLLLGCALLLAGGQLILGKPARPVPDLPLLAALAFAPVAFAARLTRMPGAASAACGAYLMPRSLLSLLLPGFELPPLLLVAAVVFDVSLWLRASDLANLLHSWPSRRTTWHQRERGPRQPSRLRWSVAGGLFGLTLAAIEPSFAVLLGADPALWSDPEVVVAAGLSTAAGALLGLSVRGKGW